MAVACERFDFFGKADGAEGVVPFVADDEVVVGADDDVDWLLE